MEERPISMLNGQEREYLDSLYALFGVGPRVHDRLVFLRNRLDDRQEPTRAGRGIERRALQNLEVMFVD